MALSSDVHHPVKNMSTPAPRHRSGVGRHPKEGRGREHATGRTLERIQAAYRSERAAVRGVSPFWLRWKYRRLRSNGDGLDDIGLVQLRAVRDEFQARGLELPS